MSPKYTLAIVVAVVVVVVVVSDVEMLLVCTRHGWRGPGEVSHANVIKQEKRAGACRLHSQFLTRANKGHFNIREWNFKQTGNRLPTRHDNTN